METMNATLSSHYVCPGKTAPTLNIKSAERTILVLRHFAATRLPQRFSELANALDLPKSSCTGLLETLIDLGILSYNYATRLYFPTEKVRALGDWLAPSTLLQERVTAAARQLHDALGETVAVGRPLGIHLQWLFVAADERKTDAEPGGVHRIAPLCDTPAALPILARRSDAALEDLISAHNDYFSARHQVSSRRLIGQVRAARGRPTVSCASPSISSGGFVSACLWGVDEPEEYLVSVFAPTARLPAAARATAQMLSAFGG